MIFELECCSIGSMQQVARSDCSKPSGRSTHGVASLSHDRLPHPPRESAAPRSVVQTAAETACTEELKSAQETPKHRASQERAHKAARTQGGQAAEKGGGTLHGNPGPGVMHEAPRKARSASQNPTGLMTAHNRTSHASPPIILLNPTPRVSVCMLARQGKAHPCGGSDSDRIKTRRRQADV